MAQNTKGLHNLLSAAWAYSLFQDLVGRKRHNTRLVQHYAPGTGCPGAGHRMRNGPDPGDLDGRQICRLRPQPGVYRERSRATETVASFASVTFAHAPL